MRLLAMLHGVAVISVLSACGTAAVDKPDSTPSSVNESPFAYVRLPAQQLTAEFVRKTGFNRDHTRHDTWAFGYINRDHLNKLTTKEARGITELDPWAFARGLYDKDTLELSTDVGGEEFVEDYHNYDAMTAELQRLADSYPSIAKLESAGRSVQGRELWTLKISDNVEENEAEPNLLYIANMHGDEVVGRELMIYLSRLLTGDYEASERIRSLVDNAQIFIMPSMNPDGFERRSRYNANNSDLNRNFPDFTSDPRDVPGNRQPETKAVMDLHTRQHFTHALNFHGGDVCFNMPWDTKANRRAGDKFGDDALMSSLARTYADANPTMRVNSGGSFDRGVTYGYEWYEVDGGLQDWSNYYRRSFHATIELSYTKWPSSSQLPVAWEENRESVVRYLEQGIFGIHLRVRAADGSPVEGASVAVSSATRDITYDTSVIHRATLPGIQQVRITKSGFQPLDLSIDPSSFDGTLTEVVLTPTE